MAVSCPRACFRLQMKPALLSRFDLIFILLDK
jgi:DNA replicative helicase MCM subunit Mcm2 (Cdc46/Mcm family)